ncbi:unnamed protein product [Oppiella nova]|uniref:C2H2-type domain-containing protein n=1 Tax=Oppiella nova TaxID=334625 RepID=A0A7R9M6G5_9ACAR|nr:unnamed protein product [Oppiella nova]CAG2171394.1 unnamed protein product [Oppiella nova]
MYAIGVNVANSLHQNNHYLNTKNLLITITTVFKLKKSLYRHKRFVHQINEQAIFLYCSWPKCDYKALNNSILKNHKYTHVNIKNFPCDQCHKCFNTKSDLNRHKNIVHLNVRYVCDWSECGKQFTVKRNLIAHKSSVHLKINFTCNEHNCGKKFALRSSLNQHKQYIHSDIKPFVCRFNDCRKGFKTRADFNEHMNRHLNIKPHKCHYNNCGKCFVSKSELSSHL